MLIVMAGVFQEQGGAVMEEEDTAQHIGVTLVPHELRLASRVAHRNSEMVILKTTVAGHTGLCTGKDKDTGFPIPAHFVVGKGGSTLRAIEHHAGENAFHGSALGDGAS